MGRLHSDISFRRGQLEFEIFSRPLIRRIIKYDKNSQYKAQLKSGIVIRNLEENEEFRHKI